MAVSRPSAERWSTVTAWRAQHRVAAVSSWEKLMARPFSTVLIWLVVAISLALPSTFLLTLDNLGRVAPDLTRGAQLSVMLRSEADLATARLVEQRVGAWPEVSQVSLIPREQALMEFAEQTGLSSVLMSLENNPLPHTLLVAPAPDLNKTAATALVGRLAQLSEVAARDSGHALDGATARSPAGRVALGDGYRQRHGLGGSVSAHHHHASGHRCAQRGD